MRDDEFFVGYAPPMPARLAAFVTRVVLTIGGGVLVWAAVGATGHVTLEGGTFEFGHPTTVSGLLIEQPYPGLQVDGTDRSLASMMLLVAPGKHGADAMVRGLNGQRVTMTGTRIQRGEHTMLEVEPSDLRSSRPPGDGLKAVPYNDTHEDIELTGEIVDSKCFLGVMVPGSGKTHSDCASLCLRGGIPPALHVKDYDGKPALLLLTTPQGEPIHTEAVDVAGRIVTMRGSVARRGEWLVLKTDPAHWRGPM